MCMFVWVCMSVSVYMPLVYGGHSKTEGHIIKRALEFLILGNRVKCGC